MTRPAAERRVDRFILAARTLGDQAARIFATDALIDYAAEQTRAAIAERDRAWAKALDESHYDYIDGLHYEKCVECAPLADLLAEGQPAGKERTE